MQHHPAAVSRLVAPLKAVDGTGSDPWGSNPRRALLLYWTYTAVKLVLSAAASVPG